MLETITANFEPPDGFFINEDPPLHTGHRSVLGRVFTPRRVSALEPKIRELCAQVLDPLIGAGSFDFIGDFCAKVPMRVIGMLLGIPEADQEAVRLLGDARLRRVPGEANTAAGRFDDTFFGDYLDFRVDHPSDDLMTDLLGVAFEDDTGTVRHLRRDEILTYVNLLASAGNETTNRLLGWTGKVLGDHPDQRRQVVEDRSLIPNAVEEVLRFEPPAINGCRYVTRDVEHHGQMVPAGSTMMLLRGAANRDDRAFPPDGDVFDIHRARSQHLTFGYGVHFCLGASLARVEARIALDEVLDRFPDWEVDHEAAELDVAVVRGWRSLPLVVR
jgi:cytochrome P450